MRKYIPRIQMIENDLLRRSLFVISVVPLVLFAYVTQGASDIIKWHKDSFSNMVSDCYDVWKTNSYRQNKYVFHDFSKDDF